MLFLRNLRLGMRLLRRNPSFAASAVAVMALGIGATTAVFSVVKGVLLTPQIWMTYGSKSYSALDLVVRGSNPAGFIAPVKEAVHRLGAGRPVHDVRLLSDYVAAASADTRFALFVLGAFALLAVTLTIIGVYAVVPTQRRSAAARSRSGSRSAPTAGASCLWSCARAHSGSPVA